MYEQYGLTEDDFVLIPNAQGKAKLRAHNLKVCYTCLEAKPADQFRPSASKSAKPGALAGDCMECEEAVYQRYLHMEPLEICDEDKTIEGSLGSSVPIREALKERGYNYCNKCHKMKSLDNFPTSSAVCVECRKPSGTPSTCHSGEEAGTPHPNTKLDDSWGPSTPPPIPIAITPEEIAIIHKTVRDKWAEKKVRRFREVLQVNDGILSRKEKTHLSQKMGPLGYLGFLVFSFEGNTYLVHRAIYAIHHGVWSPYVIEHVNGNKLDNRISNLRRSKIGMYKTDIKNLDRLCKDAMDKVYRQRNPYR